MIELLCKEFIHFQIFNGLVKISSQLQLTATELTWTAVCMYMTGNGFRKSYVDLYVHVYIGRTSARALGFNTIVTSIK